jgi:putative ABC transport system permease protein
LISQRALVVGLIITSAITVGSLMSGPMYARGAGRAILASHLGGADPVETGLRIETYTSAGFDDPVADERTADRAVRSALRRLPVRSVVEQGQTKYLGVRGPRLRSRLPFAFRDGITQDLVLFEGRPPTAPGEVMAPIILGVHVGDTLTVRNDSKRTSVRVVGLYAKNVYRAQTLGRDPFAVEEPGLLHDDASPSLLMTREGFDDLNMALDDPHGLTFLWDVRLDFRRVQVSDLPLLPDRVNEILASLQEMPQLAYSTELTTSLSTFIPEAMNQVASGKAPIFLVVLMLGAVGIAALMAVTSFALARQSFELAVLRSRGARRRDLLLAQSLEGTLAGLVSIPLGVGVGVGLALLARRAHGPSFHEVPFPISPTWPDVWVGALGAAAGVVAFVAVSVPHASRTTLEERRTSSRARAPLLTRFPFELGALVAGGLAYWELRQHGVTAARDSFDPLALLAPSLLLIGAGLFSVRLIMWFLRGIDGVLGRVGWLPLSLASKRLARSPATSFGLALVLVLTLSLFLFASSIRGRILEAHHAVARASYGADWVVAVDPPDHSLVAMRSLPRGSTAIFWGKVTADTVFLEAGTTVVGIDPYTYAAEGFWQAEYSSQALDTLLDSLKASPVGALLPRGTSSLEVVADVRPSNGLGLTAAVETPDGRVARVSFGPLVAGVRTYRADAPAGRLLSINVVRQPQVYVQPGELEITLQAVRALGGERWSDLQLVGWGPLRWDGSGGSTSTMSSEGVEGSLSTGLGDVVAGVVPPMPVVPAATVSMDEVPPRFEATINGLVVPVRVVAHLRGFPGVLPGTPALVLPEQPLYEAAPRSVDRFGLGLAEIWSAGSDDPVPAIREADLSVREIRGAREVEAVLAATPQSLSLGMEYAAGVGGLAVAVVGLIAGLSLGQRRRSYEIAALQAVGVRRRHILGAVVGEQGFLVAVALAVALGAASFFIQLVFPYLANRVPTGYATYRTGVRWSAVVWAISTVASATTIGLFIAIRSMLRVSPSASLRGEAE